MNGIADSLYNVLMGWFKTLARTVWDHLSDLGDSVKNLGDNWLVIAVILVLAGIAIDWAVWFFRWRPDKVWRTRLQRMRAGRYPEAELPTEGYLEPVGEVANPAEAAPQPMPEDAFMVSDAVAEQPADGTAAGQPEEEHRHVRTRRRADKWINNPDYQDD